MIAPNKKSEQPRGYTLMIQLADITPAVWRTFTVPARFKLAELHEVIQRVMGWQNCHMHEFNINGITYGRPDPDYAADTQDECEHKLKDLELTQGDQFLYTYDFGDDWVHHITVEELIPKGKKGKLCRVLDGKRATPPEDCGGPYGYPDFLEAVTDSKHEEHESILEWVGGKFDPESFGLKEINDALEFEFG